MNLTSFVYTLIGMMPCTQLSIRSWNNILCHFLVIISSSEVPLYKKQKQMQCDILIHNKFNCAIILGLHWPRSQALVEGRLAITLVWRSPPLTKNGVSGTDAVLDLSIWNADVMI